MARCPLALTDYDGAECAHSETLRLTSAVADRSAPGRAECAQAARVTASVRAEVGSLQCLGTFTRKGIDREPATGAGGTGAGAGRRVPQSSVAGESGRGGGMGDVGVGGFDGDSFFEAGVTVGEESAQSTLLVLNQTRRGLGSRLLCMFVEERRSLLAAPNERFENYPTGYSPRESIYVGTVDVLPLEQCRFTSDGRLTARSASLAQRWHFVKGVPPAPQLSNRCTHIRTVVHRHTTH